MSTVRVLVENRYTEVNTVYGVVEGLNNAIMLQWFPEPEIELVTKTDLTRRSISVPNERIK